MKFNINLFLFFTITYPFGSIESRYHGSNIYVSEYAHVKDDYKPERGENFPDSNIKLYGPNVFKRPLKQTVKQLKVYSNYLNVKNRNANQKTHHSDLVINEPKPNILSMHVGEHEVKVSSALHSKHIDIKSKDGINEISVNPKFSHIIEVFSRKEPSTVNEKELAHTKMPEVPKEKMEESFAERLDLDSNFNGLVDVETSTEPWLGTVDVIDENIFPDLEEEKFEHQREENLEESVFNDEFEGSGEEFTSDNAKSDQNAPKDGRLLSLFSQRNKSSPCTTPKGEKGQCRRIRECILSDALNNFNIFLQQLCLVPGALVGICCPDNPVIEVTNTEENITETSAEENAIEQPPEGCGLNTKTRIVGGTISAPHEWTWMVALLRRNKFYCGGVIINNWYILTAAHCVLGMNVKDLTVRLGEYDFNENTKQKEDISVAEIKRHAQFVTITFQHDIALLKLQRRIRYSKFVGSICLPTQKARDYSDVKGTVVGWGTVSFGGAASPVLRQVTVPVWKNNDCDRTYFLENISDAFLCAGSPEKGEDACQGDSGGPLMTLNEKGRWEVIGLVSWGRRCGDPTYPGVYTRVTTYLDWILQNID